MYLFKPKFWLLWFKLSFQIKGCFLWPTLLSCLAGICITLSPLAMGDLGNSNGYVDAADFFPKLILFSILLMAGGLFALPACLIWAYKLVMLVRAYLSRQWQENGENISEIHAAMEEAGRLLKTHRGFLLKTGLVALLVSSPLSIGFSFASTMALCLTPEVLTQYNLPASYAQVRIIPIIISLILMIILSNYSIATLVVAAERLENVGATTREALLLCLKKTLPLTLATIIATGLYTLISTPYAITGMFSTSPQTLLTKDLINALGFELWQNLSGILIIPMGTLMLAEALRPAVNSSLERQSLARDN
jgi:hypothetical protein